MALENDKIKDLFSSKLNNFEPEVPASVWNRIDLLLPQMPSVAEVSDPSSSATSDPSAGASKGASSAGKTSLIKTIAIVAGLAAAVAVGVIFVPKDVVMPVTEDTQKEIVAEETRDSIQQIEDSIPNAIAPLTPLAQASVAAKVEKKSAPEEIVKPTEELVHSKPKEEEPKEEKRKQVSHKIDTLLPASEYIPPVDKKPSGGIALALAANAGLASENISKTGTDLLFSAPVRSAKFIDLLKEENSQFYLEHNQPISLGLTISKRIAPRFSIETGLVYTYLSSRLTSASSFNIKESQRFYYLGIPFYINYTLYKAGKTNIYLSAGAMVQKDVRGEYVSNVNIPILGGVSNDVLEIFYSEPYYIKKSISQSNLQLSTHLNLGVSYPIYRKVSLYGAFGGAYYFDAGNEYRTIFSDRPFQLDLNLGVRFDF